MNSTCTNVAANLERLRILASGPLDSLSENIASALPADVKVALEKKLAEKKEKTAGDVAELILLLLQRREEQVMANVGEIRRLRSRIAGIKRELVEIEAAVAFGKEKSNWMPLVQVLGTASYTASGTRFQTSVPVSIYDIKEKDLQGWKEFKENYKPAKSLEATEDEKKVEGMPDE